ncbi:TBC-domain-containing protein [Ramicandelaber brevisporus]|nr:TBC-domain-containing protein [Ramicandelaber brevisporus]
MSNSIEAQPRHRGRSLRHVDSSPMLPRSQPSRLPVPTNRFASGVQKPPAALLAAAAASAGERASSPSVLPPPPIPRAQTSRTNTATPTLRRPPSINYQQQQQQQLPQQPIRSVLRRPASSHHLSARARTSSGVISDGEVPPLPVATRSKAAIADWQALIRRAGQPGDGIPPALLFRGLLSRMLDTEEARDAALNELRALILARGIPHSISSASTSIGNSANKSHSEAESDTEVNRIRTQSWLALLGVASASAHDYMAIVKRGPSASHEKIRGDTLRTLATDESFTGKVSEQTLSRILNVVAWGGLDNNSAQATRYVQGMNVLLAPFAFVMPELTAAYAFSAFLINVCPMYVAPTLTGVYAGLKLLDRCLAFLDPQLHAHFARCNMIPEVYGFARVMTLSASCPPLVDVVLELWDFYLAFGAHLNILVIVASLVQMRDELLSTQRPNIVLDKANSLLLGGNARYGIEFALKHVKTLPDDLYNDLVQHLVDPDVATDIVTRKV